MKIFLKILKYAFLSIPLLVIITLIVRIAMDNDPPESQFILNNSIIRNSSNSNNLEDFVVYSIRLRNPFTNGDTFRVSDAVYLESSRDLQLTLRSKKNRFEDLRNALNAPESTEKFSDLLRLYVRVTTRIPTDTGGVRGETLVREVIEISADVPPLLFENNNYEYMRVSFGGIYIDYRCTMSRLDLFIFDNIREINLGDLDNARYLGRVTLFDINMPRERTNLSNFKIYG